MFGHIRIYNCFYVLGAKNRSRVRKVVQGFLWLVFPANIYARKNISYKDERDRTDSVKRCHSFTITICHGRTCETIIRLIIATPGTLLLFQAIFNIYT